MNEKVAQVPPGSRGLLVLPYFAAAATPRYNPEARGTIIGLTFSHTRIDLARAFMEGITLDMKDMLNSLITSGTPVTEARILGGPTKSSVWNQIQADVYGIPVETLSVTDATVVGAAVLAGVGAGIFDDIRSGADRMVSTDIRYEPRGEFTGRYEKLYAAYCDAFDQLDSGKVFTRISSLQRDAWEDEE
jgi:xylulokinase